MTYLLIYILANSIYDTKSIKNIGLTARIRHNNKCTKNKNLLKLAKFTKRQKEIYKKYTVIENAF